MDKPTDLPEWLPLVIAAQKWGYSLEGLRRRLRQLRQNGYVEDIGRPPEGYVSKDRSALEDTVRILWANPQTALISSHVPAGLLDPRKGRRKEALAPKKRR